MEEEIWKQHVSGYWVSSFGRAKNKEGVLKVFSNPAVRPRLATKLSLPRAVYEVFVGEIPKGHFIYHKDKNSFNNKPENLVCISRSEKSKLDHKPVPPKVTKEIFIERAVEAHGDKYDYSECVFTHIRNKVMGIKCPEHGLFDQIACDHTGGHGCRECYRARAKTWTQEQDDYLRENYYKLGIQNCVEFTGKTRSAVLSRGTSLGIVKKLAVPHKVPAHIFNGLISRGTEKRGERGELDFDKDYIWELYEKQEGKCAMTGWDIKFSSKNLENTVSIDRIDCMKGCLKENVQLVHKDVNIMKNRFSDPYFYKVCKAVAENRQSEFIIGTTTLEWDFWHDTDRPVTTWTDISQSYTQ